MTDAEMACKALEIPTEEDPALLMEALRKAVRGKIFSERYFTLRALESEARTRLGQSVEWPDLWLFMTVEDVVAACKRVFCRPLSE